MSRKSIKSPRKISKARLGRPVHGSSDDAPPFPIVGVGASAGGLAALSEFLEALPAQPGVAIVVISHMNPTGKSILDAVLAQKTPMPVRQARDGDRIEVNHVYVSPPGRQLTVRDGVLHTQVDRTRGAKPTTIDRFFASLAADRRANANGVVLSGTGSDGTEGLKLIRAQGGVTFAQDPGSAQFDSMPASAIDAGCIDFVLPPALIARQLLRVGPLPVAAAAAGAKPDAAGADAEDPFTAIVAVLSRAAGVDFSEYKEGTLRRRITRRMALKGFTSAAAYLAYLRSHVDEPPNLYKDILIHVSGFFRDAEAFRALDRKVIGPLVRRKDPQTPIRVWVPGCACGEEVYSIGMLLLDRLGPGASGRRIQVFGSDISASDIDAARAGRFSEKAVADIPAARLKRYFDPVQGGYQVRRELRELCVFACQEVGSDPPYSNLDLISCRNLLIYFSPPLQERVLGIFHYALRPGGMLFLGRAEALVAESSPFTVVDKKYRIYARKPGNTLPALPAPPRAHWPVPAPAPPGPPPVRPSPPAPAHEIERLLLDRYSPPGFHVDANLAIRSFVGDVSPYLQPASGQANLQLVRMLPATMALDVRAAIDAARTSSRPVKRDINWEAPDGGTRAVRLVVMRVAATGQEPGYLVMLEPAVTATPAVGTRAPVRAEGSAKRELTRLSQQLAVTRGQLQKLIEEHAHSVEELRAANEEAQSGNEELQSSNEELQTAKEELQSSNEELSTLNDELQNRNLELDQLASELGTLIAVADIPIVHLDARGRVHRFSPAAQGPFNLIPTDVGREISQVRPAVALPGLDAMIDAAIRRGEAEEREVRDAAGRWQSLRVRPFPSPGKRGGGALIALVDIDASKRHSAAVVETMSEPLLVLDRKFQVVTANPAFYRTFALTDPEVRGARLFDLGDRQWDIPELRHLLQDVLPKQKRFENFRVENVFPKVGRKALRLNGQQIVDESIGTQRVLIVFRDVTDEEGVQARLRDAREEEEQRIAYELHDLSSEGLASLAISLARLAESVVSEPAEAARELRAAQQQVRDIASNMHELARRLHPSILSDLGLAKALTGECAGFEEQHQIPVSLRIRGEVAHLPAAVGLCVFRVVQEALRNVARHARANAIKVRVDVAAVELRLTVQDRGQGFAVDTASERGGLGLLGMADRVAAVNGSFAVESAAGKGTTIRVSIPLGPSAAPPSGPSRREQPAAVEPPVRARRTATKRPRQRRRGPA